MQSLDELCRRVKVEQDAVSVGHLKIIGNRANAPTLRASPHPQQRRNCLESTVVGYRSRGLIGHREELDILLETFGHRKLVRELVVTLHRFVIGSPTRHCRAKSRLGDVVTNSEDLPFSISWA